MKFKEYRIQIQRTLPDLNDTYRVELPNKILDLAHMILGMVTEIEELFVAITNKDSVNISEELCDILWYVGNYMTIRDIDLEFEFSNELVDCKIFAGTEEIEDEFKCLYLSIASVSDLVKKNLAYKKPIGPDEIRFLEDILAAVNNLAVEYEIDLELGMDRVIAKLQARYPDKFDETLAVNRNLSKEREVLEGGNNESS